MSISELVGNSACTAEDPPSAGSLEIPHWDNGYLRNGYFDGEGTVRIFRGTGIALSIAKKAMDRMGGSVGVESELGKGSTFWLELPKG